LMVQLGQFLDLENNQWVLYNGHKRVHAIKFRSIAAPNGLIANLFGPEGRQHDSGMLAESGLRAICNVTRFLLLDDLYVFMETLLIPLMYTFKDHSKEQGSPLYRMNTTLKWVVLEAQWSGFSGIL